MPGLTVVSVIVTFIVASIVLLVGTSVMGGVSSGFDCTGLQGYVSTGTDDAAKFPAGTWAGQCHALHDS